MPQRRSVVQMVSACVCLAALLQPLAASAQTIATAVRGPSTGVAGSLQSLSAINGVVDLNPELTPVVANAGYTTVTRAAADVVQGTVNGYAGIDLATAIPGGIAPNASVDTMLTSVGMLTGAGSEPVTVTVEFAFDGAFVLTQGAPTLNLVATLAAGSSQTYSSTLGFFQAGWVDGIEVYEAATDASGEPYDRATPELLSATPDLLAGVLRVSFDARPGSLISFAAGMLATAGPGYDGAAWLPAAGAVDFLHTGALSIYLPQGYSLAGDTPLFRNIVHEVPEPGVGALVLSGVFMLAMVGRRTRRPSSNAC